MADEPPGMIRAFFAVDIGADARAALERAIVRLRETRARVGWVHGENLHVTLAFLGDIPADTRSLASAAATACTGISPFPMAVGGVGTFGPAGRPRVVWAGVSEGGSQVGKLAEAAALAAAAEGLPLEDRPFHAHVTLGRVRAPGGAADLARALGRFEGASFGSTTVREVLLMRSELGPDGPAYTVLSAIPLGGPAS